MIANRIICSLSIMFCVFCLRAEAGDLDNSYTELLSQPLSIQLVQLSDLCQKKQFDVAERRYRRLLNAFQLAKGFGHRDVKSILEGLAVALNGLGRKTEARDAASLASDIERGTVPIMSNSTAYMRNDESLVIFKHILSKDAVGGALIQLDTGDAPYAPTVAMVDGMVPGQAKLMPPLSAGTDLDEASGIAYMPKELMRVFKEFNYRYRTSRGVVTARLKNKAIERTAKYVTGLKLSLMRNVSTSADFLDAFYKDTEKLTIEQRISLAHFLQPGVVGMQETYAWLYVASMEEPISEELAPLRQLLPTVFDLVKHDKLKQTLPAPNVV